MQWTPETPDPKTLAAALSARHVALGASLSSAAACVESDRACSAVHLRVFAEHVMRQILEAKGEIAPAHTTLYQSIRSPVAKQVWATHPGQRKLLDRLRIAGNDAAHGRRVREEPSALLAAACDLAEWLLAPTGPLNSVSASDAKELPRYTAHPSPTATVAGDGYFLLRSATETTVLQLTAGEVEVVTERFPFLLFAYGDQLWEWEPVSTRVPVWTTEDFEEIWSVEADQISENSAHVPLPDGRLVNVRTGAAVGTRLVEPDAQAATDQRPTMEQMGVTMGWIRDVQLQPSFGPWILVQETDHTYTGGVHSNWECVFWALDMRTGMRVDLLSDLRRWLATEPGLLQRAAQTWIDKSDPDFDRPSIEEVPKLSVTKVAIHFDAQCRPIAVVQMTGDEGFAFSDGLWDSYTRSVQVPSPELPPSFAEQSQLPASIVHWAQENMPDLMGWSHLAEECGTQLRSRLDHPPDGW